MTRTAAARGWRTRWPRGWRWRWRWRARIGPVLAAGLRDLLAGLYYLSPMYDSEVGRALLAHRAPLQNPPLQNPPPGHPEVLATGTPLSAAERELWARLR